MVSHKSMLKKPVEISMPTTNLLNTLPTSHALTNECTRLASNHKFSACMKSPTWFTDKSSISDRHEQEGI
jgi:hypothetical protein